MNNIFEKMFHVEDEGGSWQELKQELENTRQEMSEVEKDLEKARERMRDENDADAEGYEFKTAVEQQTPKILREVIIPRLRRRLEKLKERIETILEKMEELEGKESD